MAQAAQQSVDLEKNACLKRKRVIYIIGIAMILGIFVGIYFSIKPFLKTIVDTDDFRIWIQAQGVWGYLTYIGIMMLQVVVAFVPGEMIEVGAGYAFGAIGGMLVCLAGAAAGSAVIFAFTKRFGIKMVEAFIPKKKMESMKFIQCSKRLNLLTFVVFFIPGTPKDLLTYFMGVTSMKTSTFLLLSTVARIPSVITSTIVGNAIGMKDYVFALIVFGVTGLISLIGILIYNQISKRGTVASTK